jgi:hypothetical protein
MKKTLTITINIIIQYIILLININFHSIKQQITKIFSFINKKFPYIKQEIILFIEFINTLLGNHGILAFDGDSGSNKRSREDDEEDEEEPSKRVRNDYEGSSKPESEEELNENKKSSLEKNSNEKDSDDKENSDEYKSEDNNQDEPSEDPNDNRQDEPNEDPYDNGQDQPSEDPNESNHYESSDEVSEDPRDRRDVYYQNTRDADVLRSDAAKVEQALEALDRLEREWEVRYPNLNETPAEIEQREEEQANDLENIKPLNEIENQYKAFFDEASSTKDVRESLEQVKEYIQTELAACAPEDESSDSEERSEEEESEELQPKRKADDHDEDNDEQRPSKKTRGNDDDDDGGDGPDSSSSSDTEPHEAITPSGPSNWNGKLLLLFSVLGSALDQVLEFMTM